MKVFHSMLAREKRLLVVMATGTGKSFLAMQIAWKLQKTRSLAGHLAFSTSRTATS